MKNDYDFESDDFPEEIVIINGMVWRDDGVESRAQFEKRIENER